jgi:hypothetical protein
MHLKSRLVIANKHDERKACENQTEASKEKKMAAIELSLNESIDFTSLLVTSPGSEPNQPRPLHRAPNGKVGPLMRRSSIGNRSSLLSLPIRLVNDMDTSDM